MIIKPVDREQKFKLGQQVYYVNDDNLITPGEVVGAYFKDEIDTPIGYRIRDGSFIDQDDLFGCKETLKKHHIETIKERINKKIDGLNLELKDIIKKIEENNND